MKKTIVILGVLITGVVIMTSTTNRNVALREGFVNGTPEIKHLSALAFAPDGILLIGDSKSASVFALDTKDNVKTDKASAVDLKKFDAKVAEVLGTTVDNITISDVAVNPVSKNIYCAVHLGDGTPALLKIAGDKITSVPMKDVSYSSVAINNVPAEDAKDQRGRPLRVASVSDISFADGKVMVTGLSNQEFSSTFRSIPFPFTKAQDQSSLEIYHAAHQQYETFAPIRTFTTAELAGKKYIVASFTCTPLVLFPIDELKAGKHVKGRTVAEMGSGNSPLDMITMTKNGERYLLMSNSNRPVFKVKYKTIEEYQGSLTTPVAEPYATEGVEFVSLPMVNVLQLDKLDDAQILVLQRRANGDLDLFASSRW